VNVHNFRVARVPSLEHRAFQRMATDAVILTIFTRVEISRKVRRNRAPRLIDRAQIARLESNLSVIRCVSRRMPGTRSLFVG
jgi:hypothetical protein